ncbi:MAG: nuclear transport factor 2 family protein [Cyclobacteriaceae bacterium]
MKKLIMMSILAMFGFFMVSANTGEEKAIERVINVFSKAGDKNDVSALEACLDDNYRVVMNQLFGSEAVTVIPRSVYLQKIGSKEWGGDHRTAIIEKISVNGNTAVAKVNFKGEKMTFKSLIMLIKDANGQWKLISDTPVIA